MKVITVRQPWAWAIIRGGKDVENRSRNIVGSYRGEVAIHVSQTPACRIGETLVGSDIEFERDRGGYLARSERFAWPYRLPVDMSGHIIGTVEIASVHTDEECYERDVRRVANLHRDDRDAFDALPDSGCGGVIGRVRMCSPWAMDEHKHIVLANPKPFAEPIPAKGQLGLWNWPPND